MQHLIEKDYSAKELMVALQNEAKEAVNRIASIINDYEHEPHNNEYFKNVLLFEEADFPKNPTGELRKSVRGGRGLYVFVVKEDFSLTKEEVFNYNEKCNGAGFKKYGAANLHSGDHFYQGSTTKSLQTRLRAHYSTKAAASAIQLNNPHRLVVKGKLKVFIFPMVAALEHRPFFIKMIEDELHERFPTITGSRRI